MVDSNMTCMSTDLRVDFLSPKHCGSQVPLNTLATETKLVHTKSCRFIHRGSQGFKEPLLILPQTTITTAW